MTKKDVEGFLSSFNYNQYGATNIDDVSKLVYAHHDDIQLKLAGKSRAFAPPAHLKNDIDIKNANAEPKRIR